MTEKCFVLLCFSFFMVVFL